MKPCIDSGSEIEDGINVKPAFLWQLLPELLSYLTGTLYRLLILDVQLFELNNLCQIPLNVNYFVLFWQKLVHFGLKVLDNSQPQSVGIVGVTTLSISTPTNKGKDAPLVFVWFIFHTAQ